MSIWDAHYDAIYGSDIAVDGVLTITCGEVPQTLRVIDWTSGVQVGFEGVDVGTLRPAADVRASELVEKGIEADDGLRGAVLTLNGKEWTVVSHLMMPAPTGQAHGEVRLWLEKAS